MFFSRFRSLRFLLSQASAILLPPRLVPPNRHHCSLLYCDWKKKGTIVMDIEEPLEFEFDDPLVPTPPPGKTKRCLILKEILLLLLSANVKEKECDLVKQYIYLVLVENWLCWDPPFADKFTVLNLWYKFLRNCSLQITSTDWRPYASKVPNRASYLLQTANPAEL